MSLPFHRRIACGGAHMPLSAGSCMTAQYFGSILGQTVPPASRSSTRDRLKLIARVVNVEEWAKKGPLGTAEHKLLVNYNDKPILTRPQQNFYSGIGSQASCLRLRELTGRIARMGTVNESPASVAEQVLSAACCLQAQIT